MSKKVKRVLYIVGAVLFVAVVVLYAVFPAKVEYYFNRVKDFINKPLPIVGISVLIIMNYVYKIFVLTKFGQGKLKEVKEKNDALQQELSKAHEEIERIKESVEQVKGMAEEIDKRVVKGFSLSSNVKIRRLTIEQEEEEENV